MMHTVSERLQAYFGWDPNQSRARVQAFDLAKRGGVPPEIADLEPPQPRTFPVRISTPSWMSAVALVILFATCFVGGNIWWVAIVLVVLVILVAIHTCTVQIQRRA